MSAKSHSFKSQLSSGDIILGDYHDVPQFMLSDKLIRLPDPASPSYAHQMLARCLDHGITTIYVLNSNEAEQLMATQQLFAEYGIQINTNEI